MLSFLLLTSLFFLNFQFSFSIFSVLFLLYYFMNLSLSFSSISFSFNFFLMDSFSFSLVYLTVFVMFISYVFSLCFSNSTTDLSCYLMFLPCFLMFSSYNFLSIYISYEFSLIPIIYIIVKWGSYPERSLSALMLLFYTSFFSLPFMGVLAYFYYYNLSFVVSSLFSLYTISNLLVFMTFLTFAVKLPVYGLHFWLPMAHVEAPTFGSMILAGILLKLGGIGLIRFSSILSFLSMKFFLFSYFLFFLVFSAVICCMQSDFKRLVAYSSVSHMMAVPILLLSSSNLSQVAMVSVMVFHGLSSPILFSLVGLLYSMYSTRQLVLMRGLITFSPLLSFVTVISFLFSLSAPPYPSFFSEVLFFLSAVCLSFSCLPFFLLFAFLSLVYNLNWSSHIVFSSFSHSNMSFSFSFLSVLIFFMTHFLSFLFLFLIPLF